MFRRDARGGHWGVYRRDWTVNKGLINRGIFGTGGGIITSRSSSFERGAKK